ncbi:hypothetical protein CLHUN_42770 [Ruminiclostridium hungatei]|uniref:Uncharacterized protein n=1 Tax=Ruminiclostridium hungatei TaxID=48256 RepID=A0A1V4SDF5_RUMHU|nr:hypothetical protein [Ruminiclostridium hungatei]OPX41854.1 hypothetical protein CLHUN_42770 [Ruminiclostridium hungatei]
MATWQFTFSVIPEKVVLGREGNTQYNTKLSDFDDSLSWDGYYLSESSIEKISETLKQTKSWSDSIRQFGCIDETCIELFYEKNTLLDISIRLDLRSLTSDILKMIIDFVKENKALILTTKGVLIKPVLEDFVTEIRKSDAHSFAKNPQEFLTSLNK